ncbi:hypothetical protein [Nocardia colli]|uniref:hypothetical protein n=1 Tax=Nocardia colli TaxID=2545717 RepID=UPI0035D859D8
MPDLPVETCVDRMLHHSLDCLWGLHQLIKHEGQQHYAPYLLLRGALESTATAVWLLEPDDRKTRLEHRAAIEANDAYESSKAIESAGIPDPDGSLSGRIDALSPIIHGAKLDPVKCKWKGYSTVVKEIDERPGTRLSLETA